MSTPPKEKLGLKAAGGAAVAMIAMSLRADAIRAVLSAALTVTMQAAGPGFALGLALITDAAVSRDMSRVIEASLFMSGLLFVLMSGGWTGFHQRQILSEKTNVLIESRVIEYSESIPTIEHHERPEYHDKLELLREGQGAFGGVLDALFFFIGNTVQLIVTALLLSQLDPLLLLLPLAAIPTLIANFATTQMWERSREKTAEPQRLAEHYYELGTTPQTGKEIRIFGLGKYLVDKQIETWDSADRVRNRTQILTSFISAGGWLIFAAAYVAALVIVVNKAARGQATPGDIVLATGLAAQINGQLAQTAQNIVWVTQTLKTAARYIWLKDLAQTAAKQSRDHVSVPSTITHGVTFENVSFKYPGTEEWVVRDVNLHIPGGSIVAVVGDNGAGKSTLCKLLSRFYLPTDGRILVDGIDLSEIKVDEWRDRMSAGYQDFAKFEFIAQESVGVGRLELMEDSDRVIQAISDAGANDVLADLPNGLNTQLGRTFDKGVELSGGQWQKLALGRSMMRDDPLLLILDEPTAALDADTEHLLFERYAQAAREARKATGAITILVSHRFSTVRMADLIIVIEGGYVREFGSHDELRAAGGLYADLYQLQARGYV